MNDNDNQEVQESWTVVVMTHGSWGCGNSYTEAVGNCPYLDVRKDEHILVLFTEPVNKVNPGFHGLSYKWVDEEGAMAWTTVKNGLNEVLKA